MPRKLLWTAPRDAQIRRLRLEGATWDQIAAALAISRDAVIARGRRIGAQLPPRQVIERSEADFLLDPTREPLPPGHPASWDAITAGTQDAGSLYTRPAMPI